MKILKLAADKFDTSFFFFSFSVNVFLTPDKFYIPFQGVML